MKNVQIQQQQQQQTMQQTLTAQQVLQARLLELPYDDLLQRIENECLENPWLEKQQQTADDGVAAAEMPSADEGNTDYNPADDYRSEDDIPTYLLHQSSGADEAAENIEYGETLSFYDQLKQQMAEYEMTEHEHQLLEYLVGSLDEDGLLRKPLGQMADELAIYHAIDTSEEELQRVLAILWQFDPPGIGARSLQECLRLQIERQPSHPQQEQMLTVINTFWEDFKNKRWDIIRRRMQLTDSKAIALQRELTHLNPRPGAALGEAAGRSTQQVTPDFIVEVDAYGQLVVSINQSGVPDLVISPDAIEKMNFYSRQKGDQLSRAAREDIAFTRRYMDRGNMFINAMRQRSETMMRTMAVIVQLQREFFLEGDETQLHPMILEDVAERTGQDLSTVSRACNSKYVQTPYGTFPLKYFFSQAAIQKGDDTLTSRQVMHALRQLIEDEKPNSPLSDDKLATLMQQQGYNIARRTIAKYRELMGIPVARMRRR